MAKDDHRGTENGHGNHDTPPVAVWSGCAGSGGVEGRGDFELRSELTERTRP